jgi:hypothetical protein
VTTSEFDDIKTRLARIENKRRLVDLKDKDKPSLHHAGAGSGDPAGTPSTGTGDGTTSSGDKPTLHRRDNQ